MADRVSYYSVTVSAVNTGTSTFDATTGDGALIQGIVSNPQNLPAVGMQVTLFLMGATVLYRPEGIAAASVGDPQISAVGAGKLSAGTMTADITLANQILTATSGQRAGITAMGLQAWDSGNNLVVSLTGATNLLTGTTQTATTGRRIVSGAAGTSGRMTFVAPDGTETEVVSYAESGVESIRMGNPVESSWAGWNAVTAQGNEVIRIASGQQVHYFGGDTSGGAKQYIVYQASNSGNPGVQPTSTERMKIDTSRWVGRAPDFDTQVEITNTVIRHFLGATTSEGTIDTIRHGVADTRDRSPRIQLRGKSTTRAGNLKFVADSVSTGGNPRIECTDTADNYGEFRCSAVVQTSSQKFKTDIVDPTRQPLDIAKGVTLKQFRFDYKPGRIVGDDGKPVDVPGYVGPPQLGVIAEQTPVELLSGDGEGINVGTVAVVALAAVKDLEARVAVLEQRGRP